MDKSDGWGIAAQGEQFVESGVRPGWQFLQSVLEPGKGIRSFSLAVPISV